MGWPPTHNAAMIPFILLPLIGLGVLFLLGGWLLERLRRQLVQRIRLAGPPPPSRTP